ncbi:MAG: hypothetical protein AB7H90_17095 [Alphaproteobacteria bacterium]
MPRRSGPGLLLAVALASAPWGVAGTQVASAQGASRFDGQYTGELTLTALIQGDCTEPPRGALYPLTVSGGQVRFTYLPRFATILTGSVAENGSFRASAPTRHGVVEMTGRIRGDAVRAQIVSPSCRYTFETKD